MRGYFRRLAFFLRLRRLPEDRIRDILTEVRDLSEGTEQAPGQAFGTAIEYAQSFERGTHRSVASRTSLVLLATLLAVLAADFVVGATAGGDLMLGPLPAVGTAWVIAVVVLIAAMIADHRLPAGFPPPD